MMGGKYLSGPAYNIYQMTFFVGFPLAVISYFTICKIFPPPGLGIQEELEGYGDNVEHGDIIEGTKPDMRMGKDSTTESVGEKIEMGHVAKA
jgi:hypothetical protein